MASQTPIVSDAVLAILREAQDTGIKKVTKTSLVKFVYLLDAFVAEETQGKPFTGLTWRFLHFGPFAFEVVSAVESLVAKSFVEQEDKSVSDKDFVLYSLTSWKQVKNLDELGVPGGASSRIRRLLREFAYDLPGLLNFVYFYTQPMDEARPGAELDFAHSKKTQFSDVKQIKMAPLDVRAIKQFREKLGQIIANRKKIAQENLWEGEFDEIYYEGLSALEDPPLPVGAKGRGKISL